MAKPPRPDKLPGPIRYKKPSDSPADRPLERIHREFEDHKRAQKGQRTRACRSGWLYFESSSRYSFLFETSSLGSSFPTSVPHRVKPEGRACRKPGCAPDRAPGQASSGVVLLGGRLACSKAAQRPTTR